MTLNVGIRKLIKSYIESGFDAPKIYKMLNKTVSRATVYRWVARITKNGISSKTSPGRPRTVRTKSFIAKIKRNLCQNKKRKSARKISREEGCSQKTVLLAIRDDLSLKAYKKIRVPALTDAQIAKRKSFCIWIRNHFDHESCRSIMFSDEKWFDQDGQYNRQNDRIYAKSREAATKDMGTRPEHKFPFKVMVWIGVTFSGLTQVVILPQKTTFDSDFYVENVLPIVKRDGIKLIGENFIFQQDGAKPHTSRFTMESIKNLGFLVIAPDKWPPNSPDLNPLDYFFWDEVECHLKTKKCNNVAQLAQKIKESINEIPIEMIQDSIDNFRSRVHACEKNSGGLILNKYY